MPHNFCAASSRDPFIHGAQRPGYSSHVVPKGIVDEWVDFMKAQGIRRVVCLLDEHQLRYYEPKLLDQYATRFERVVHCPVSDYGLPTTEVCGAALAELWHARRDRVPIVIHCSAGMGRTGLILAAWLRYAYGVDPVDAIAEVVSAARDAAACRNPREAGDRVVSFLKQVRSVG